jgi:hypothetical protein
LLDGIDNFTVMHPNDTGLIDGNKFIAHDQLTTTVSGTSLYYAPCEKTNKVSRQ